MLSFNTGAVFSAAAGHTARADAMRQAIAAALKHASGWPPPPAAQGSK